MARRRALRSYVSARFCGRARGTRIASPWVMRPAPSALVISLTVLTGACGGATFTIVPGEDGGSESGGGSGGSGSGSGGSGSGGGGSNSGGSGGSSNGGNSGSSGGCNGGCVDSGLPSPCPSQLPASGRPCAPNGLVCEYGMSPVQSCDNVANCSASVWQIQGPSASANCAPGPGPMCPASFASVPQNTHCNSYGLICDYPQGRCACTVTSGPVPLDASAAARWACQNPATPGCPMPRAPLGSACTQQGLSCDYGACSVPGGTSEVCSSGIWKPGLVACPAAASGP
jgi:hypothetical protein